MCDEEGYCFPVNPNLAELYGVSVSSVSSWMNELRDAGFIDIEIDREGSRGVKRRVSITSRKRDVFTVHLERSLPENAMCSEPPLSVEGEKSLCNRRLTHIYTSSLLTEKDNNNTHTQREGEGREENEEPAFTSVRRLETRFPYSKLFNEDLTINLLLQQDGFGEAWRNYVRDMRRARKTPTESGARKLLSTLALRPKSAVDALKVCAEKGWKTLEWQWLEKVESLNVKTRRPIEKYASASEQRAARTNNYQPRKEPIL